ncbi:MAG TPA: hypothetical protein VD794_03895 [Flavisolibacter sp.]|nr:hypothetical protein [Flavisolibacter sp.]
MKSEEISILLERYLTHQASEEEMKLVNAWYQSFDTNEGITGQMKEAEIEISMTESFNRIKNALEIK